MMGSLQDKNQNSENLGMTQGAVVNKCITVHQNGDNSPGTSLYSPETYPSTRSRYDEYVQLYDHICVQIK